MEGENVTDYNEIICDLFEWKYEELNNGNRIKASIINKVENRIINRRIKWIEQDDTDVIGKMWY